MVSTRVFVENKYFLSLPLVLVVIAIFIYRFVDGTRCDLYYCELNIQTRFGSYTSFPCTPINILNCLPSAVLERSSSKVPRGMFPLNSTCKKEQNRREECCPDYGNPANPKRAVCLFNCELDQKTD